MLVSRFLLDLQTANQRSLKLSSNDPLHLSTGGFDCDFDGGGSVAFARIDIVGSLGEGFVGPGSLVCDPDPDDDDDDVSETCYWSRSTSEDEGVELADRDKAGKSGDVESAMADASTETHSHPWPETDIEEVPGVQ